MVSMVACGVALSISTKACRSCLYQKMDIVGGQKVRHIAAGKRLQKAIAPGYDDDDTALPWMYGWR